MKPHRIPKAWIEVSGLIYGAAVMNAPARVQERFNKRWYKTPPHVVVSNADVAEVERLGREWWDARARKGPGVDW